MNPLDDMWLAAQLLALWTSGAVLARIATKLWQSGQFGKAIGQLTTPIALWLMFGIGGVIVMLRTDESRFTYGVNVGNSDVFLGFSIAIIAAAAYGIAFGGVWRNLRPSRSRHQAETTSPSHSPWPIIAMLLAIDIAARAVLAASGVYYAWTTSSGSGGLATSVLGQLSRAAWPILVSLLCYAIVRNLRRIPAAAILSVLLLLDLAIGQRRRFLLVLLLLLIVGLVFSRRRYVGRTWIAAAMGSALLILVLFPTIEASRLALRSEVGSQHDGTESLLYLTEFIPAAAATYLGGDETNGGPQPVAATIRLAERVSNWSLYLSSIVHQSLDGYAPQGASTAIYVASSFIPGGDQYVDADRDVIRHYDMGRESLDAAGSTPADAFSHLHIVGVILVFILGGGAIGATAKALATRGDLGLVLLIAAIPTLMPFGDSFINFLVGIRNMVFVLALIAGLLRLLHRHSNRPHLRFRSPSRPLQTRSDTSSLAARVAGSRHD